MVKKNGDSGIKKYQELEQIIDDCETTVIRISSKNYESLRERAFYDRSTIREIADNILEEELKK